MVKNNCEYCIMEVSSQALKYDRVYSINFFLSCFTNIGEDHISDIEHSSFEDYFSSKLKIIDKSKKTLVNSQINIEKTDNVIIFDYSGIVTDAKYKLQNINSKGQISYFDVNGMKFSINLFGQFNVFNAFVAISAALEMGIQSEIINEGLKDINVPGRVEFFYNEKLKKLLIVDYAHNKLSYTALYSDVKKEYPDYKIITVFGCPGGKALTRRIDLPNIAEKYSDYIYITEEDYGMESLYAICDEIYNNISDKNIAEIEYDREKAIQKAFYKYNNEAIILILGKGRERTQNRNGVYESVLSDVDIVKTFLES